MKKVSIVMPVYGVEKYIGDCIKSVINQTLKDFELIIVDDETKDKSIEVAEELLKGTDIDYKVVHRKNGGLSAARNTGIENAEGEYVICVDSDDVINPEYLETLYNDAKNNNVDLSIASFKWVKDHDKFDFDERQIEGKVVDKQDFLNKILSRKIFPYFGCFMVKRDYIIKNNLWHEEECKYNVDHSYQWRLMVNVPAYTYNPKKVYNYYVRPGSIMTGTKLEKMMTGFNSVKKCAEDLKDNPYFDSSLILARYKISVLNTLAKLRNNYDAFEYMYNNIKPKLFDCIRYPDIRIKLLVLPMLFGKKVFFSFLRRK